jgi:hypothetical protein
MDVRRLSEVPTGRIGIMSIDNFAIMTFVNNYFLAS